MKPTYRILVVDDEAEARNRMAHELIGAGYAVEAAENEALAWKSLQLNNCDLLIADNRLPNWTGMRLLEKIRSACLTLPVLMVIGNLPSNMFEEAPWLMPDGILFRPFVIDELLAKVEAILAAVDHAYGREPLGQHPMAGGF